MRGAEIDLLRLACGRTIAGAVVRSAQIKSVSRPTHDQRSPHTAFPGGPLSPSEGRDAAVRVGENLGAVVVNTIIVLSSWPISSSFAFGGHRASGFLICRRRFSISAPRPGSPGARWG